MACTDVNAIMVGYRGRVAMLKAVHGGPGKPEGQEEPPGKPTKPGSKFRTIAKWHNAKQARKGAKT